MIKYSNRIFLLCAFFAIFLITIYLVYVSFRWEIIHDSAIMHYIAFLIDSGKIPYVDIFDFNFPGIYFIHWLMYKTIGVNSILYRVCDLTILIIIAINTYRYLVDQAYDTINSIAFCLIFPIFILCFGPIHAFQRETLIIAILSCLLTYHLHSRWMKFFVFFLIGLALFIKPSVIFLMPYLFFFQEKEMSSRQFLIKFLLVSLFPLMSILWLVKLNALDEFLMIMTEYVPDVFTKIYSLDSLLQTVFSYIKISEIGFILVSAFGVITFILIKEIRNKINILSLILYNPIFHLLIFSLMHLFIQKRGSVYHFFPFIYSFIHLSFFVLKKYTSLVFILFFIAFSIKIKRIKSNIFYDFKKERSINAAFKKNKIDQKSTVSVLETVQGVMTVLLQNKVFIESKYLYDLLLYHKTNHPIVQNSRKDFVIRALNTEFLITSRTTWGFSHTHPLSRFNKFEYISEELKKSFREVYRNEFIAIYKNVSLEKN